MSGQAGAREVPAADRSVILRRHEDVAEVVLHRPHKLNAMNMTWINDLLEIVPHWSAWTGWSSRRSTAIASGAASSWRWRATSAS